MVQFEEAPRLNGDGGHAKDPLLPLTASICFMAALVTVVLGIKIWWFKHRLSFEQSNEAAASNARSTASSPALRRGYKDKKMSQQVCESVVVHGVFRKRQEDELEPMAKQTNQLPPIRKHTEFSQSTPNLLVPPTRSRPPLQPTQQTAIDTENIDWSKWPVPTREPPKPPTLEEEITIHEMPRATATATVTVTITAVPERIIASKHSAPSTPTPTTTPIDMGQTSFQTYALTHTQAPSQPSSTILTPPQPARRLLKSASSSAVLGDVAAKDEHDVRVRFEETAPERSTRTSNPKLVERRPTGILRPAADLVIEEMRNSATVIEINEPKIEVLEECYTVEFSDDDSESETETESEPPLQGQRAWTGSSVEIEEVIATGEFKQTPGSSNGEFDESQNWKTIELGSGKEGGSDSEMLGRIHYANVYKTTILQQSPEPPQRAVTFSLDPDLAAQYAGSSTADQGSEILQDTCGLEEFGRSVMDALAGSKGEGIAMQPKPTERRYTGYSHDSAVLPHEDHLEFHVDNGENMASDGTMWRELEQQLDKQSTESADEDFVHVLEADQQKPKGFGMGIEEDWDSFEKLNVADDEQEYDSLLWDDRHHKKRQQIVHFQGSEQHSEVEAPPLPVASYENSTQPRPRGFVHSIEELYAELEKEDQVLAFSQGHTHTADSQLSETRQTVMTATAASTTTITTTSILKEHVRSYTLNSEQHSALRTLKPRQKVTFDTNTEEYYLPSDEESEDDEHYDCDDDNEAERLPSRSPSPPKQPPPPLPTPMQRMTKSSYENINFQYLHGYDNDDEDEDDDNDDDGEQFDEVAAELADYHQGRALLFSTQIALEDFRDDALASPAAHDSWSAIRQHRHLTAELQKSSLLNAPQSSGHTFESDKEISPPITPPSSPVAPRPAYRNPLARAAAAALASPYENVVIRDAMPSTSQTRASPRTHPADENQIQTNFHIANQQQHQHHSVERNISEV